MRLDKNVRRHHAACKVRTFALVPGVLMRADVVPRPAVEGALDDARREIRRQIIAQAVALVDDAPKRAARRLDGRARAVAQAGRKDALMSAFGIEGKHVGAILLPVPQSTEQASSDGSCAAGVITRGAD